MSGSRSAWTEGREADAMFTLLYGFWGLCTLLCALVCGFMCLIFALRCMRRAAKVCAILAGAALCPLLFLFLL